MITDTVSDERPMLVDTAFGNVLAGSPGNTGTINSRLKTSAVLVTTNPPPRPIMIAEARGLPPVGSVRDAINTGVVVDGLQGNRWFEGFTTARDDAGDLWIVCTAGYPLSDPHMRVARIPKHVSDDPLLMREAMAEVQELCETLHAQYLNRP